MDVFDLDVIERQQIGNSFIRKKDTEDRAQEVLCGSLRLPPHPVWQSDDLADWQADPFADRNWRFQRNTLRWLVPLGYVANDGDEIAAEEWLRVARSWTTEFVEAGNNDKEVWGDMATGLRAIVLVLGAGLVADADLEWYRRALEAHKDWLCDPANLGRGNHALHQHQGLLVVSSFLRDSAAQKLAVERMVEQFSTAFDDEGANDEGSAAYHQLNLIWWSEAWMRVRAEGLEIPEIAAARLEAANDVLAHLSLPSGHLAQIGDGPITAVREGLGPFSDWVASRGESGKEPLDTLKVLRRGYVLSRTSWSPDATYLAMRFGERQASGHPHEDRGALLLHTAGIHWLVDSGFSSYQTKDSVVLYLRSMRAHNVALLEGVKADLDAPVNLVKYESTEHHREFVLIDERYGTNRLERRVVHLLEPDCVVVLDSAVSADGSPLELVQRWHLNPKVRVRRTDRGFALVAPKQRAIMQWLGRRVDAHLHPANDGSHEGWVYPRWKTPVASNLVRAVTRGAAPVAGLLFARSAPTELGVVEAHINRDGVLSMTVMRGPRVWKVVVGEKVAITELERVWGS